MKQNIFGTANYYDRHDIKVETYSVNFCSLPGRCRVCGGQLGDGELEKNYIRHIDYRDCILTLQNTLIQHMKNTEELESIVDGLLHVHE